MRTIWQPTATSSSDCFTHSAVSMVSQVIMDCTTTGWLPPMITPPCAGIADDHLAGQAAAAGSKGDSQ